MRREEVKLSLRKTRGAPTKRVINSFVNLEQGHVRIQKRRNTRNQPRKRVVGCLIFRSLPLQRSGKKTDIDENIKNHADGGRQKKRAQLAAARMKEGQRALCKQKWGNEGSKSRQISLGGRGKRERGDRVIQKGGQRRASRRIEGWQPGKRVSASGERGREG